MQHVSRRLKEERSFGSKEEEMKVEDLLLKEIIICQMFNVIVVKNLVIIEVIFLKNRITKKEGERNMLPWQGTKDFFYFSTLTGSISEIDDLWPVDSGASRNVIGDCDNLRSLRKRRLSQKEELGDNNNCAVKGIGKTSIELE